MNFLNLQINVLAFVPDKRVWVPTVFCRNDAEPSDGSLIEIVLDVEEGHPWRPYNNRHFRVHPSTLFIRTENRREEHKL